MVEQTPKEIKNAGKAFTPEEIAEGKAKRDAIWASEPVEVAAKAEGAAEPEPEVGQGSSKTTE